MKKNYILPTAIIYAVLLSGIYFYTSVIKPKSGPTPIASSLRGNEYVEKIDVTQKILNTPNDATRSAQRMSVLKGETALDLIKRTHAVKTKDYDFGTLVESIDGVRNGMDNNYWILYVNEKQATVGADSYTIQKNDFIEWRHEAYAE